MKHDIEDAKERSATRPKYLLRLCEIISESGENSSFFQSQLSHSCIDGMMRCG